MGNKYYTPTIEEFHVGFECEWRRFEEDWHGGKINSSIELYDAAIEYEAGENQTYEYRVKYLDKEDIESLGWEFVSLKYDGNKIRKLKKEYLNKDITSLKSWEIEYCYYYMDYNFDTNHLVIHNDQEYSASYVWFDGIIKNKSELKLLLKQLGIE